ncbi:MAG: aspartyl/asparaginyl beta-hydroxylase domain-containing protein [Bacteroidota bacterium]
MSQLSPTKTLYRDRIKLPYFFDVAKMQEEIQAMNLQHFMYYNVIQLRAPAHMVDPSIPAPPATDDFADGSWTEWLDTAELKSSPYFQSLIHTFSQHTKVTLVRLLRLEAGAIVREHTDPTLALEVEKSVIRLTVPIVNNDEVTFYLNDTEVEMQPGECWYLRLSDPHKITNFGSTERINLTIDMIPNEWVRTMIAESQGA